MIECKGTATLTYSNKNRKRPTETIPTTGSIEYYGVRCVKVSEQSHLVDNTYMFYFYWWLQDKIFAWLCASANFWLRLRASDCAMGYSGHSRLQIQLFFIFMLILLHSIGLNTSIYLFYIYTYIFSPLQYQFMTNRFYSICRLVLCPLCIPQLFYSLYVSNQFHYSSI